MEKLNLLLSAWAFVAGLAAAAPTSHSFVLVHGANLKASSWNEVRRNLDEQRLPNYAPDLYHSKEVVSLSEVANRLCTFIEPLGEKVSLVGHSQGGAIITEATSICPTKISKLVYIAAVIPLPGEGVFDRLSESDIKNFDECAYLNEKLQTYEPKGLKDCHGVFMGDLSGEEAKANYELHFTSEPASIGNSRASYPLLAMKAIPKFYFRTTKDLIVSVATQNIYIGKFSFERIVDLTTSHSPLFSQPALLANLLAEL